MAKTNLEYSIVKNLKYFKYNIEQNGGRSLCPYHKEKKPSFGVHFEKKVFHCLSCGVSGNLHQLAEHLGIEVDKNAYIEHLRLESNKPKEKELTSGDILNLIKTNQENMFDPKDNEQQFLKEHIYLDFRDIPEWAINNLGIRFDNSSQSLYAPIYNEKGKIVSYFKRFMINKYMKCFYPKNFKLQDNVYGIHLRDNQKIAIVTEGIIDAIKVQDFLIQLNLDDVFLATSVYSSKIFSQKQYDIFLESGIEQIITFLDNDKAGLEGIEDIKKKFNRKKTIKFYYPDYSKFPKGKKDPDELELKEFYLLLKNIKKLF